MIVWGSKGEMADLGARGTKRCPTCDRDRPFRLKLVYKVSHIWYLFKWVSDKRYMIVCDACQRGYALDARHVDAQLAKSAIPWGSSHSWVLLAVLSLFLVGLTFISGDPASSGSGGQTGQAPLRSEYVRPDTAPNGQPWPAAAGYIRGYQWLRADGLSTVTVDNSRNDSDAFVKLFSLDAQTPYPVRWFYLPAFSSFTLDNVTAGRYDIRYRDLGNGRLSRSEAFDLKEIADDNGTRFTKMTMTLYKVVSGNMRTYDLSDSQF